MRYTIIILLLLSSLTAGAQYTMQGKIEYERKTNLISTLDAMDEDDRRWLDKFRSQIPKYNIAYFDLYFTPTKTYYKPGRAWDGTKSQMWFAQTPAAENMVYTDFNTRSVKAAKLVYEEKFLVQDTMRKIKWRIMDEIRTIQEYKCRKAVGKIMDSVYVVAFYTEDIMATGGPEMFSGLPGMILEVAIPRLYTTWVATKVDVSPVKDADFVIPEKGKKTDQKELQATVNSSFKRWGKSAQRYVWWTML
jgi:GLPGLI family protein